MSFVQPYTIDDALKALSDGQRVIVAGATDIYPDAANRRGWNRPPLFDAGATKVLDISRIGALKNIASFPSRIEIGAMVTWTEAVRCSLGSWFDGVRLAAREIGGQQIQNRATLVGNLCNASPAADGVPALLALDASIRLRRLGQVREVALSDFVRGNRDTDRRPDELATHLLIPRPDPNMQSLFYKLGARSYLVISIASVAVNVTMQKDRICDIRIAVGACSPTPQRLTSLEARLLGKPIGSAPDTLNDEDFESLSPIDDIRASAHYRRQSARELVMRALESLS